MRTWARILVLEAQPLERYVSIVHDEISETTLAFHLDNVSRYGDTTSFRALFDHFGSGLKAFYLKRGLDERYAEDLVQEVMLRVWQKAGSYQAALGSVSVWIFRIARNVFIDRVRREQRFVFSNSDPAWISDSQDETQHDVFLPRRRQRLQAAVSSLPPAQATIIHQVYVEGKSLRDVAKSEGLPEGTVKTRARLAVQKIRAIISQKGG